MNVVRARRDARRVPCVAAFVLGGAVLWAAAPGGAQVARLAPIAPPVELVDPSERISGNAAAGIVLVGDGDAIGSDRLWAYLSPPIAPRLKLKISSIDGRYYAEIDYATGSLDPGWVALELPLKEFGFLERTYTEPMNEIAALLSDADAPHFYPVRWAARHRVANASPPPTPKDADALRVYVNTERAQAFVVVEGAPAYCRDASAVSGFKFNAICELELGAARLPDAGGGAVIDGIEVFRRSGVRTLAPLALDLRIRY